MGSSVFIKLHTEGLEFDKAPLILELYTSDTRELNSSINLVFSPMLKPDREFGHYTELTSEKLDEIIEFYREAQKKSVELLDKRTKEQEELKTQITKVSSVKIYKEIRDEINQLEDSIDYLRFEINHLEHLLSRWIYGVRDVWYNNPDYKLYYYVD